MEQAVERAVTESQETPKCLELSEPQAEEPDSGDLLRQCQTYLIARRRALGIPDDGGQIGVNQLPSKIQIKARADKIKKVSDVLQLPEQRESIELITDSPALSPSHIFAKLYRRDIESNKFRALSWQAQSLWLKCFIPLTFFAGKYAGKCYPSPEKMIWYSQLDAGQCDQALGELLQAGLLSIDGELKNGATVFVVRRP